VENCEKHGAWKAAWAWVFPDEAGQVRERVVNGTRGARNLRQSRANPLSCQVSQKGNVQKSLTATPTLLLLLYLPIFHLQSLCSLQFEQHCPQANICLRNEHATLTWLKVKLKKVSSSDEVKNTKISAMNSEEVEPGYILIVKLRKMNKCA